MEAPLPPNTDDTPTVISVKRPGPFNGGSDLRGRRLGHFELIEPIGVGGMAAVLRARDLQLGRTVALKILPPEMAADPENVARFHQEARAAAKLDHENVARVFFCGEDQGLHFIAFEFVEGVNLRTLLDRRGPLPAAEAVPILLQVATGLAHAASRGVVHRDVKPSNVILTPEGRAKIVDMGLARHLDNPGDVTQSGVTLGTFDYISPEQALEPRTADVRSDIYSLGCTFYHLLTGVPPVPEGTAAKKLHHHQSVPPVDPRSLNPAIPDALAAILAHMMAKDPDERYQRPEHLVQHLIALARTLRPEGGSAVTSESVLFMDAPLPAPPHRTPALVAAAAVLLVALLVAVIEFSQPTPRERPPAPGPLPVPNGPAVVSEGPGPPPVTPPNSTPPRSAADEDQRVSSVETLRDVLRLNKSVRIRLAPGEYRIERREDDPEPGGLSFTGSRLVLEAEKPDDPPPVIKLVATAEDAPAGRLAVLAVTGTDDRANVTLRGIRFEADLPDEAAVVAVAAVGLNRLDVEGCTFVLPDGSSDGRMSQALAVEPSRGEAPSVRLAQSWFARGSAALALQGRWKVTAQNCAFGPHAAVFDLRDTKDETSLHLEHCSALLADGAVFHFNDDAAGRVTAGHCLFSRPGAEGMAVLVRHSGTARNSAVEYRGVRGNDGLPQRNGYHNLSALWVEEPADGGTPELAATVADCRRLSLPFFDDGAVELLQSPWQESQPLAALPGDPQQAFAVDLQRPALRLPRGTPGGVLGVLQGTWGKSYPTPLPSLPTAVPPAIVRNKVVDPASPVTDSKEGVYRTLASALEDAKPDDVILLKKNGPLEVAPLRLDKADGRVTLRPYEGYRPVLTLAATPEADAALFRLHDGSLTLDGLQFLLRPTRSDFRTQAVAAVTGVGQCQFKDCVVTLDAGPETQLSVAVVPDSDGVMKTTGERRSAPLVRFDHCFIRGRGDLLTVRASRRFELEAESTLAALDGSLVSILGAAKEPPVGPPAVVKLKRVTASLTEYLLEVRAGRDEDRHGSGLVPTRVTAQECLFVSAGGRSLVHFEGVDTEEGWKLLLDWVDGRQNVYGNFTSPVLDVQPSGGAERMPPAPYDQGRWLAFTHEKEPEQPFQRVRFAAAGPDRPLTKALAADFQAKIGDPKRLADELNGYGAPVEMLLRPIEDGVE